jgi:hypothetical protein
MVGTVGTLIKMAFHFNRLGCSHFKKIEWEQVGTVGTFVPTCGPGWEQNSFRVGTCIRLIRRGIFALFPLFPLFPPVLW